MPEEFKYDVFLSQNTKDKAVVRPLAERLHPKAEFRSQSADVEFQPSAFSLGPFQRVQVGQGVIGGSTPPVLRFAGPRAPL